MKKILSTLLATAMLSLPMTYSVFAEEKSCEITGILSDIKAAAQMTDVQKDGCEVLSFIEKLAKLKTENGCINTYCSDGNCVTTIKDLFRLPDSLADLFGNGSEIELPEAPEAPEEQETTDENEKVPDKNEIPVSQSMTEQVITLVNNYRAQNGLSALEYDSLAACAAQKRAVEIESYFSHTRPDGSRCFTALDECGASYRGAGENIAMGQRDANEVMNDWMNSEGHRENILNPNFTKIGVGLHKTADGRYCWTQMFTY